MPSSERLRELYGEAVAVLDGDEQGAINRYSQEVDRQAEAARTAHSRQRADRLVNLLRHQLVCGGETGTRLLDAAMLDVLQAAWSCFELLPEGAKVLEDLMLHAAQFCSAREMVVQIRGLWDTSDNGQAVLKPCPSLLQTRLDALLPSQLHSLPTELSCDKLFALHRPSCCAKPACLQKCQLYNIQSCLPASSSSLCPTGNGRRRMQSFSRPSPMHWLA